MDILTYGDILVHILPVDADGDMSLRERERTAVRRIVAGVFGPSALLCHHTDGSPFVPDSGCEISVSHGGGYAAVAVARNGTRIGVDIEAPRAQLHRVAHKFLYGEEREAYGGSLDSLLLAWTMKEAAYKAAGVKGLSLEDIRLPLQPGDTGICVGGRTFRYHAWSYRGMRITLALTDYA